MMSLNQNAFLLCPICDKEYDDRRGAPRVLPCLHTCCSTCLQDLLNDNELCCQECQTRFDKSAEGVEGFPIDTAIRNYLDFIRVQLRPTEVPCTDCPDEANAHCFCRDCFLFICLECTRAHKRTHVTKKHVLVSIEDMRGSDLGVIHRRDTCQSKGHEDQVFTFYCDRRGCDVPICNHCAVSDHNQQQGHVIRNLSDVYEDSKSTVQNVLRDINNKGNPMADAVSLIEEIVYDLTEKESEISNEIDSIFDRFQKLLEDRRDKLQRDVEYYCQSRKRDLQEKVLELKSHSTKVKTAMDFANRVMSYTTASEFLILRNILLKRILELKNYKVSIPAREDISLRFYRGASDDSFAELVNSIGNVVTKDSSNSSRISESLNSSFQSESYKNSKRSSFSDFQIELQNDINTLNSIHNSHDGSRLSTMNELRSSKTFDQSPRSNSSSILKSTPRKEEFSKSSVQQSYYSPQQTKQSDYRLPAENESGVVQTETNHRIGTPDSEFEIARTELRDAAKSMKESKIVPMVNGTIESSSLSEDKPSFFSRQLSSQRKQATRSKSDTAPPPPEEKETSESPPPTAFVPVVSPRTRPTSQDHQEETEVLVRNGHDGQLRTGPAIFNDVTCPDFSFDVLTIHDEREVSIDGKTLRDRKTGNPSSSSVVGPNQLKQYKGIIGNYSFQQAGRYYYEVDVTFNIVQPLEQTWLVFELGLCRRDDVDKHHTVERHEFARSFYVARYPEDGKLAQEFWHNRDLKALVPLCDNSPGLTVDMTYGVLINTSAGKITIADVKREKKLHTFSNVDFSKSLVPVFGTYNSDLVDVVMRLRTGVSISQFPPFLKGHEINRNLDRFDSEQKLQAENERGMVQRQMSMPTRTMGGQNSLISPRQNLSRSSENINTAAFDAAKSGLRNTSVKPTKSKFVPVTNGNASPREKPKSAFTRSKSQRSLSQTGEKSFQPTSERSFKPITTPLNQKKSTGLFTKPSEQSKTMPSTPTTPTDVKCPDFTFDVDSCHEEREVTIDGKILKNRKTGKPSSQNPKRQLKQYKGILGDMSFKEGGKYYYEVAVTFNIIQPLEQTWLVFEIGLCRRDDVDKHHTVERHEHARSFYVARYPEDGKLAQEFWHNRDLLAYVPLSENKAGLTLEVTYGFVVDTIRKKWIIADVKREKKLHTFTGVNFSKPLLPVFGTYNPDLINVEMKLRTGSQLASFPAFLKGL